MSPPIREGSGNSIGSIRLGDGTEISEVRTGAGDVLFSAIPDSGDYQWHINEGGGTTLNPNLGDVTATISGASWVSDSQSVGGYHLSHNDDKWQMDSPALSTPFTVAGWVRFDSMTSFEEGIAADDSSTWYVSSDGDGALTTVTSRTSRIRGHPYTSVGEWGFFAFTLTGTEHRLITFSNTQELADTTNNNGDNISDQSFYAGGHHDRSGDNFQGDTDFYVISSGSTLSKSQITELWEATQR